MLWRKPCKRFCEISLCHQLPSCCCLLFHNEWGQRCQRGAFWKLKGLSLSSRAGYTPAVTPSEGGDPQPWEQSPRQKLVLGVVESGAGQRHPQLSCVGGVASGCPCVVGYPAFSPSCSCDLTPLLSRDQA